jgi:hypothetical protein
MARFVLLDALLGDSAHEPHDVQRAAAGAARRRGAARSCYRAEQNKDDRCLHLVHLAPENVYEYESILVLY